MIALIEANLELCKIEKVERSVVQAEATDFLKQAARKTRKEIYEPWDIVFFDPPYADDYLGVLELVGSPTATLVVGGGLLIVEHHHKKLLADNLGNLQRTRILKQGDSALSFYAIA
jgi:16S rRNA G966 N2-methylase RsmD